MSDFLSNILSRHSQSENNVQPRGLDIFETFGSLSDSLPSESDGYHVDLNTPTSENTVIEPILNKSITTQSIQNISSEQNDNSKPEGNHQRIDTSHNKTSHIENRIIEKMNFKTEKVPFNNPNIAQARAYFGERTKSENILKPVLNKLDVPKPDKKSPNPNSMTADEQSAPIGFTDQILVKPNKEIKNQFPPNFNTNLRNGNGIREYYSEETSQEVQVPTIKIHIGRVEIKAVKQPDLTTQKARKTNKSTESLDQFLKKREHK